MPTQEPNAKNVTVIYHGNCRDGFGAAYAAWKRFGDAATYLPARAGDPPPEGLAGRDVYILDYSYNAPTLQQLHADTNSLVVIDHHQSAEEAVTAYKENVFDLNHSGAVLAWQYFHPETPVPKLLRYVEDHDLWKLALPHTRAVGAALSEYPHEFAAWDELAAAFEDEEAFAGIVTRGGIIAGVEARIIDELFTYRERVQLGEHMGYALNVSRLFRSVLGNMLAEASAQEGGEPLGIVYYRSNGGVNVSLRSTGDFDVAAIAEQYGGGGHKNAASFRVLNFADLPFTFLEKDNA